MQIGCGTNRKRSVADNHTGSIITREKNGRSRKSTRLSSAELLEFFFVETRNGQYCIARYVVDPAPEHRVVCARIDLVWPKWRIGIFASTHRAYSNLVSRKCLVFGKCSEKSLFSAKWSSVMQHSLRIRCACCADKKHSLRGHCFEMCSR